jgi:nucleotide-binding universal stress UspA family protein
MRILAPDLDSVNLLPAVRHLVGEFLNGARFEVHLLQVRTQPKVDRQQTLLQACALLERAHIPYSVHRQQTGDKAQAIRAAARRIRVDRIVLGTARSWSATRLREDAVIQSLLDNSPVPVALVAGKSVSRAERYGIAAGLGATLGLILFSS